MSDVPFLLGICFGAICAVVLLQKLWQEARTQRALGNYPLRLRLQMIGILWKTAHRRGIWMTLLAGAVVVLGGGLVLPLLTGLVVKPIFSVATVLVIIAWWLDQTCPPAVIVLTSSDKAGAKLFREVVLGIAPLRATALLNRSACPWSSDIVTWSDNLRTLPEADWKTVVHTLIDMAAIVVVDTRRDTHAVVQETVLMLTRDRARKALFVCEWVNFYGAAYGAARAQAAENCDNELVGMDQIRFTAPREVVPLLQVALRGGYVPRLVVDIKQSARQSWRAVLYEMRWAIVLVCLLSALSGLLVFVAGPLLQTENVSGLAR